MARLSIKPYTVLITATGKAPITLKLRPVPLLVGVGVVLGLPIAWIAALLYQNVQLAQKCSPS